MCRIDGSPATPEEQQVALVFREAMKAALVEWEKPVFDEAAEKCEFRRMFGKSLECIHLFYPPEILEKVADPRVLSGICDARNRSGNGRAQEKIQMHSERENAGL